MADAAICIFTKPPIAEQVKTRLVPGVGAEGAAKLAEAFLRDTLEEVNKLSWAEIIIAAAKPFEREYLRKHPVWIQPATDLDVRLETILRRALRNHPMAFAIGADSPGLPATYVNEARQQLQTHDAVLGPATDGGFYLVGLKQCTAGLLSGIEWSQPTTMQQTVSKLKQQGLSVAIGREWFDVDTPAELSRLQLLLARGRIECPHTQAVLDQLNRTQAVVPAVK